MIHKLHVTNDMIVKQPTSLRNLIVQSIDGGHPGIEKSKSRNQDLVYWSDINTDITELAENCEACVKLKSANIYSPAYIKQSL